MKPVENMDMSKIMPDFISSETANLELVKHTKKVLQRLSKFLQIIVLTNLPHRDKGKRENAMIKNNLNFPVITNSGPKGGAVKKILKKINAVSFFIDDMPLNIDSVSKECPETHCIHFLQDERINKLMPSPKSATIKLNNWLDVENYIMKNLEKDIDKKN